MKDKPSRRVRYGIWAAFTALLVAASLFYNLSDPRDVETSGSRCALAGFLVLLFLLASFLSDDLKEFRERRRRRAVARGFDVVRRPPPRS